MTFGLMKDPSTFYRMMDIIFAYIPFGRFYLDSVAVFYKSAEDHIDHLL